MKDHPLVVTAIHGIMTRQTIASWPDYFDAWMWTRDNSIKVVKKEYIAGPFPPYNVWVKNHLLAAGLASELLLFAKQGSRLAIVAHSNGADVALKTVYRLARQGVAVETIILIGAAAEADVRKNRTLQLVSTRKLNRAIAYASPHDHAVTLPARWPYGSLGATGWQRDGKFFEDGQIFTRWFNDCGHSTYYSSDPVKPNRHSFRERTFIQIYKDLTP